MHQSNLTWNQYGIVSVAEETKIKFKLDTPFNIQTQVTNDPANSLRKVTQLQMTKNKYI